jgi:hypothetical protein
MKREAPKRRSTPVKGSVDSRSPTLDERRAAATISGYLGKSDVFDQAIVRFAKAYADQTESDHGRMRKAARAGRLEVGVLE